MDRIEELETALTIISATADHIQVGDARRLTGHWLVMEQTRRGDGCIFHRN